MWLELTLSFLSGQCTSLTYLNWVTQYNMCACMICNSWTIIENWGLTYTGREVDIPDINLTILFSPITIIAFLEKNWKWSIKIIEEWFHWISNFPIFRNKISKLSLSIKYLSSFYLKYQLFFLKSAFPRI